METDKWGLRFYRENNLNDNIYIPFNNEFTMSTNSLYMIFVKWLKINI